MMKLALLFLALVVAFAAADFLTLEPVESEVGD